MVVQACRFFIGRNCRFVHKPVLFTRATQSLKIQRPYSFVPVADMNRPDKDLILEYKGLQSPSKPIGPHEPPKVLRSFHVSGLLLESEKKYFVKPDTSSLITAIRDNSYVMFTGHNGTGKSTAFRYAERELSEYDKLHIPYMDPSKEDFWKEFGLNIKAICRFWAKDQVPITSPETFVEFFKYHHDKRIVFSWDKFELMLNHKEALRELLSALKSMKGEKTGLQTFVAIGTPDVYAHIQKEHLLDMAVIEKPYFTKEEFLSLFAQFTNSRDLNLDPKIVERIYDITGGHPGTANLCGKMLEQIFEENAKKKNSLTWREWKSYELRELRYQLGIFTAWSSAAIWEKVEVIQAPIIKLMVAYHKAYVAAPKIDIDSAPLRDDGNLDVPALSRMITKFDGELMRRARLPKKDGQSLVPETVYRSELFRLLVGIQKYLGWAQCDAEIEENGALVFGKPGDKCVVLGIHADSSSDSLATSITKWEKKYTEIERASKVWLLNFTATKPSAGYAWPSKKGNDSKKSKKSKEPSLHMIHVWHDADWTEALITERHGTKITTTPLKLR